MVMKLLKSSRKFCSSRTRALNKVIGFANKKNLCKLIIRHAKPLSSGDFVSWQNLSNSMFFESS